MNKYAFVALSVAVLGATSVPAVAADPAQARLTAPVSQARQVIIDGRLWKCRGEKCTTGSQGKNQPILRECIRAAKVLGPIVEYRQGTRILNDKGLAQCNSRVEQARVGPATDAVAETAAR